MDKWLLTVFLIYCDKSSSSVKHTGNKTMAEFNLNCFRLEKVLKDFKKYHFLDSKSSCCLAKLLNTGRKEL